MLLKLHEGKEAISVQISPHKRSLTSTLRWVGMKVRLRFIPHLAGRFKMQQASLERTTEMVTP